jgi:hypothetical protein
MQFVWRKILGASCLCVDSWGNQGFCHGFFGVELDSEALPAIELNAGNCVLIQLLKQVHSTDFHSAEAAVGQHGLSGDGWSGFLGSVQPWAAAVKTADCIPVIIWDPKLRYAAVLHCGRKGTIDGLLPKAIKSFSQIGSKPESIEMAIGPGVSGECYEIGEELASELSDHAKRYPGLFLDYLELREGRYFLDLKSMLVKQALRQGLSPKNVLVSDICTICSPEFHSYRRDKESAGRQIALVGSDNIFNIIRPVKCN